MVLGLPHPLEDRRGQGKPHPDRNGEHQHPAEAALTVAHRSFRGGAAGAGGGFSVGGAGGFGGRTDTSATTRTRAATAAHPLAQVGGQPGRTAALRAPEPRSRLPPCARVTIAPQAAGSRTGHALSAPTHRLTIRTRTHAPRASARMNVSRTSPLMPLPTPGPINRAGRFRCSRMIGTSPRSTLDTVLRVIGALGLKLRAEAVHDSAAAGQGLEKVARATETRQRTDRSAPTGI